MDKRKKTKRNSTTCPYGGTFVQDWFQLPECTKGCKLASKCKAEERKFFEAKLQRMGAHRKRKTESKKKESVQHKKKQDHRGAYIPKPALDKLLRLTYHSCMRVYLFYMKEGRRQKTNQPWCNNKFVANGLKCSVSTVVTAKNLLIKGGFIKIVGGRGEAGHFGKTYIKLEYFPSKFIIRKKEYIRRLDKYAEDLAEWINVFGAEKNKLEIRIADLEKECRKWKRRCRELKGKKK